MRHALSTHPLVNHRLTVAMLDKIMRSGIPAVEIFCARQHLDWNNRSQIAELSHWFRESALTVHAVHAPMYTDEIWGRSGPHSHINITEPVKGRRIEMVDELRRALEISETVPFRYWIQHLGASGEEWSERKVESAFTALEQIVLFARQRGVEVLLENIPNELSTPERLVQFEAMTHLGLNFVFDTGHANMAEGGIAAAFDAMKGRIRSTHVHDNDGVEDSHLFPLLGEGGTVDWPAAMKLLSSRDDQYPLVLELREVQGMNNPLDRVAETFERLENLA
jgi:sugar phosphate isomerase/epimerase